MVAGLTCVGAIQRVWSLPAGEGDVSPLWVLEPGSQPAENQSQAVSRWAQLVPVHTSNAQAPEVSHALPPLPDIAPPVIEGVVVKPPTAPPQALSNAQPSQEYRLFNGQPIRKAKTMRMLVTAYSPDARSCGKWADNITASGYSVWTNGMKLVAADTRLLPFGSIISVPGYDDGNPVPVMDRGGAIKGMRLDLLYPTHQIALQWGKKWLDVTVWEYVKK